jgi:hypothetical protein
MKVKAYEVMLVIPVVVGVLLLFGGQILSFATLLGLFQSILWWVGLCQNSLRTSAVISIQIY